MANIKTIKKICQRERGSMLLELLVAITVAGILAISLCQSLSSTKEASFGAHGRIFCSAAAQALAEGIRDTPFDDLATMMTSPGNGSRVIYDIFDDQTSKWSDASRAGQFPMERSITLTPGPYPNSIAVKVSVFADSVKSSAEVNLLVSKYGVIR